VLTDIDDVSIINGQYDVNNDGLINAADDATFGGVQIIGGMVNVNDTGGSAGVIDQADNGTFDGRDILAGMVNLAQAGTATQSSNIDGVRFASMANDGNPSGLPSNVAIAHTGGSSTTEYWEVDLGSVQSIGEVTVFNRDGGFTGRLTNVFVLVSDEPFPADTNITNDVTAVRNIADFEFQISEASLAINLDPVINVGGVFRQ